MNYTVCMTTTAGTVINFEVISNTEDNAITIAVGRLPLGVYMVRIISVVRG